MRSVADFYFVGNSFSSINYNQEQWKELFEGVLKLNPKKTTRMFFLTKIVPAFIFCGASIRTYYTEKTFAYEISVQNTEEFKNEIQNVIHALSVMDNDVEQGGMSFE